MSGRSLLDHFSGLSDTRQAWKVVYPLSEILLVVLCGTLAGAENVAEIERWAKRKLDGGAGADTIIGGAGRDILRGSVDADVDVFRFLALTDRGRLREGARNYPKAGQRYSPVRVMCSHPSGETWASRCGGGGSPRRAMASTMSPSRTVFQLMMMAASRLSAAIL